MILPEWFDWSKVGPYVASIPGWIALLLDLRRHSMEKTILVFSLDWSSVEVDPATESYSFEVDGRAFSDALAVTVTNAGSRPITVERVTVDYLAGRPECSWAIINKKISQGEVFTARPKMPKHMQEILTIRAVDSTGKEWLPPSKKLAELRADLKARGLLPRDGSH